MGSRPSHLRGCPVSASGFSLIEVVISIGIVAVAVLGMVGLLGFFEQSSSDPVKREEAARAFNAVSMYLNGKSVSADPASGVPLGGSAGAYFDTVLQWIRQGAPAFVYAYKSTNAAGSSGYLISQTPPASGAWDGTLLVAQIKPLYTDTGGTHSFLPKAALEAATYTKAYIPVEVAIYARPGGAPVSGNSTPAPATLIDTWPAVIMR